MVLGLIVCDITLLSRILECNWSKKKITAFWSQIYLYNDNWTDHCPRQPISFTMV